MTKYLYIQGKIAKRSHVPDRTQLFMQYGWWLTDPQWGEIMEKFFIRHNLLRTFEDEYQNLLFRILDAKYASMFMDNYNLH